MDRLVAMHRLTKYSLGVWQDQTGRLENRLRPSLRRIVETRRVAETFDDLKDCLTTSKMVRIIIAYSYESASQLGITPWR